MKKIIDESFFAALDRLDIFIRDASGGNLGGNRRTKAYGSSTEFADFRDYVPGDDIKRIDWNIFGRFEKYVIKLFLDERQTHTRIYLDASLSMDSGEPKKSEQAIRLAAAMGYLSIRAMDKVSFHVIRGDRCEALCAPVSGTEAFYHAVELLSEIEFNGSVDISQAIQSHESIGRGDGLSIIISDFLTENAWKNAIDYLVFRSRQVAVMQILSPEELNPRLSGKTQFLDSEATNDDDGRHIKMDVTRTAMAAYRMALEWHTEQLKNFCLSRSSSFITLSSAENAERVLLTKATEASIIK